MKKTVASLALFTALLVPSYVFAAAETQTADGWYIESHTTRKHNFDVWQLTSGYSYAVADNLQLYLSTSVTSGNTQVESQRGVASGIKLGVTPKVSIESALTTTLPSSTSNASTDKTQPVGFEVSSQIQLTDNVNLRASYDYEAVEHQYMLGIGYRF